MVGARDREQAAFKGGQTQIAGRMETSAYNAIKHQETNADRQIHSYFGPGLTAVLFQVPNQILEFERLNFIVTPASYATRHNVPTVVPTNGGDDVVGLDVANDVGNDGNGDEEQAADAAADRPWNKRPGYKTNANVDYSLRTPNFEIECCRLLWLLQNIRSLPEVIEIAASIVNPGIDTSKIPFPSLRCLRDSMVKLDLLHMLSRREFYRPLNPLIRCSRYLSPDSSPQGKGKGKFDYFCIIEEMMRRELPLRITLTMDPFGGFTWIRRSMPYQTIGRERGSVAVKLNRTVDSVLLENAVDDFWGYRLEVKGSYMDQGSGERGIPKAPVGGRDEVGNMLTALKKGELHLHQPAARNMAFLPNSVDVSGTLHIHGNALESALKRIPEWPDYDMKLRAFVKYNGEGSYKALALETVYVNASSAERVCIHQMPGDVPSHKWEHMEDLHLKVIFAYIVFRKYYCKETVGMPGTELAHRLELCARCDFFGPFAEFVYFFAHAVGCETSWFEGCFCHELALQGVPGGFRRRRRLLELSGHQHCPWGGKRMSGIALGHCDRMCDRIKSATSPRFTEALTQAPTAIAERIVIIHETAVTEWCDEVLPKYNPIRQIPASVAGGFGAYCGYSLQEAKACVRNGFDEFAAIANPAQITMAMDDIYGRKSITSIQLFDWCTTPGTDLRLYPYAFVEVQERSFPSNSERYTDLYRTIRHAQSRFMLRPPQIIDITISHEYDNDISFKCFSIILGWSKFSLMHRVCTRDFGKRT